MRTLLIPICLMLASSAARAEQFHPNDAMISRIAQRFKTTFQKSGISGVEKDVLKCYDDSLRNSDATKECVVYDVAALMLDRQMQQVFVARGMHPSPAPLYTDEAFDARSRTYGFPAFGNNESEKKLVGPAAKRVLDEAMR